VVNLPIAIRDATLADLETIVEFNHRLALESENKTLPREILTAGVAAGLADAAKARYFIAVVNDVLAGQLMLTREWSDWRNGDIWWIQSVYVLPEARRGGVFRALFTHVEQLAKCSPGVVGLRLYVEEHNDVAQRVYASLGMKPAGYHVLETIWPAGE
jgi:GNAT superfamily N-acetyltransferase